jgi:hypothetical protein
MGEGGFIERLKVQIVPARKMRREVAEYQSRFVGFNSRSLILPGIFFEGNRSDSLGFVFQSKLFRMSIRH